MRSELLREVNDRIREVGHSADIKLDKLEFVCECGGRQCEAMVSLTAVQYDGIRLGPDSVLAPDHMPVSA